MPRIELSVWIVRTFPNALFAMSLMRLYQKIRCFLFYARPSFRRSSPKKISAMLRVRNEGQFLFMAVSSIVNDVDEVLLIDNRSTDATPSVIVDLAKAYPSKVRAVSYDHDVLPVGSPRYREEYVQNPGSPRLTSVFYNWCMERCAHPYVLKWDGDMIALPSFAPALDAFRRSGAASFFFEGITAHPDGRHFIPNSSNIEARVVPKHSVTYVAKPFYEEATGPGLRPGKCAWNPLYLHMKYAKRGAVAPAPLGPLPQVAVNIASEAISRGGRSA